MDGKRYIRVLGRPCDDDSKLSTGEQVKFRKPYWVEVQPIEWLMDKSGWVVAKKCLFAGIQFDTKDSYDGDFSKTFMKHYLDTYFAKEMEPMEHTKEQTKTVSKEQEKPAEKKEVLKEKLVVTSKGKNDSAVAVAVKGSKKSNYSLTDKSDNAHIAIAGMVKGRSGR